jgi:hypothetical protein
MHILLRGGTIMSEHLDKFTIRFDGLTLEEAGKKAARLRQEILDAADLDFELEKEDPKTQDAGTILAIVLSAGAVVELAKAVTELAKGVANYLSREHATITIEKNGKVVAAGLRGTDAAQIAGAFAPKK